MDKVAIAYWVCFFTGSAYALISALMGGLFGLFHGGEGAGAEMGPHFDVAHDYGTASGGHGGAFSAEAGGEPAIAPLSPVTIAVFLATFGGVGIISTNLFRLKLLVSLPISAGAGFLVAAAIFWLFYHFFTAVQASSEPRMAEVIGLKAEVTVPITSQGMGEIAFITRGIRICCSARSQEGEELARHQAVRIVRQVGSTLYVAAAGVEDSEPAAEGADSPGLRD